MGETDTLITNPEEVTRLMEGQDLELPFTVLNPPVGRLMSVAITVFGADSVTLQAINTAGDVVVEQTVSNLSSNYLLICHILPENKANFYS